MKTVRQYSKIGFAHCVCPVGTGVGHRAIQCNCIAVWGGGDLVQSMPGCVCPKVKDMSPFSASSKCIE